MNNDDALYYHLQQWDLAEAAIGGGGSDSPPADTVIWRDSNMPDAEFAYWISATRRAERFLFRTNAADAAEAIAAFEQRLVAVGRRIEEMNILHNYF